MSIAPPRVISVVRRVEMIPKLTLMRLLICFALIALAVPAIGVIANYDDIAYEDYSASLITPGWTNEKPTYSLTRKKRAQWLPGANQFEVPIDATKFSQLELRAVSTAEACGSHTEYILYFK